jgi:hypothetical protein
LFEPGWEQLVALQQMEMSDVAKKDLLNKAPDNTSKLLFLQLGQPHPWGWSFYLRRS